MTDEAKARREGYDAARRGVKWSFNPYPIGSVKYLAWVAGFAEGRKKRLKLVDGSRPCE